MRDACRSIGLRGTLFDHLKRFGMLPIDQQSLGHFVFPANDDDVATAHIAMDVAALLKGTLVTWVYGLSVQIS
jgi:hypothetical protein